ncbi:MAG: hypothetical protein V4604_14410 [Bacteroidota bacterium]
MRIKLLFIAVIFISTTSLLMLNSCNKDKKKAINSVNGIKDTLYFKVDGTPYGMPVWSCQLLPSQFSVSGETPGNVDYLLLKFPLSADSGSLYTLPDAYFNYITDYLWVPWNAIDGTITITERDSLYHRIEGTFEATVVSAINPADTLELTEGYFSAHY